MINKVKDLVEQKIKDAGYILDDILYVNEDGANFLRIIIDKKGIIDVEDCVTVSQIVNPILDQEDLIEESYILDVCSKEKGCE